MEILGIGPLELLFIIILILIVAGPRDLQRAAYGLGRLLNRLYHSPSYHAVRRASQELRNLPQRLAREANLDELRELEELKRAEAELHEAANTIAGAASSAAAAATAAKTSGDAADPYRAWVAAPAQKPTPQADRPAAPPEDAGREPPASNP
jgi:sec-independent protein translocase protein TatB